MSEPGALGTSGAAATSLTAAPGSPWRRKLGSGGQSGSRQLVFLLVAPGVVAGLLPWLLTGWEAEEVWLPVRIVGAVLLVAGVALLLQAFARFVVEGLGTPAPVAPTERLVVGGLYRYVRNPMYLAVLATVVGQGLLRGPAPRPRSGDQSANRASGGQGFQPNRRKRVRSGR